MSESIDNQPISSQGESDLSSLLSSPQTLSKISDILSKHGIVSDSENRDSSPQINDLKEQEVLNDDIPDNNEHSSPTLSNIDNSDILGKMPMILSLFSSVGGENSMLNKQQNDLLRAIRPYLSTRRQEVLDSLIKFERLGAMLKKLTQGEQNVSQ